MTLIYLTKNINNLIIPLKINPVASFVFLRPYAYFKSPFQFILDSSENLSYFTLTIDLVLYPIDIYGITS